MSIEIGNRVIVNTAELQNEHGVVVEKFGGKTSSTEIFEVVLERGESVWVKEEFLESEITWLEFADDYDLKLDITDNVVVAVLFKKGKEIGRGHGHLIHSGNLGIAQAISYACKRIYQNMGGTFNGQ